MAAILLRVQFYSQTRYGKVIFTRTYTDNNGLEEKIQQFDHAGKVIGIWYQNFHHWFFLRDIADVREDYMRRGWISV